MENKENLKFYAQEMLDSWDAIPTEWIESLWEKDFDFMQPLSVDEYNNLRYDLGIWGFSWLLSSYWSEKILDNIDTINEELTALRLFETDRGVIVSVDAAGFDFFERVWIPLYKILN